MYVVGHGLGFIDLPNPGANSDSERSSVHFTLITVISNTSRKIFIEFDVYIFGKILNFYTFGRYYQDGRGSFPLFSPDQNFFILV